MRKHKRRLGDDLFEVVYILSFKNDLLFYLMSTFFIPMLYLLPVAMMLDDWSDWEHSINMGLYVLLPFILLMVAIMVILRLINFDSNYDFASRIFFLGFKKDHDADFMKSAKLEIRKLYLELVKHPSINDNESQYAIVDKNTFQEALKSFIYEKSREESVFFRKYFSDEDLQESVHIFLLHAVRRKWK